MKNDHPDMTEDDYVINFVSFDKNMPDLCSYVVRGGKNPKKFHFAWVVTFGFWVLGFGFLGFLGFW